MAPRKPPPKKVGSVALPPFSRQEPEEDNSIPLPEREYIPGDVIDDPAVWQAPYPGADGPYRPEPDPYGESWEDDRNEPPFPPVPPMYPLPGDPGIPPDPGPGDFEQDGEHYERVVWYDVETVFDDLGRPRPQVNVYSDVVDRDPPPPQEDSEEAEEDREPTPPPEASGEDTAPAEPQTQAPSPAPSAPVPKATPRAIPPLIRVQREFLAVVSFIALQRLFGSNNTPPLQVNVDVIATPGREPSLRLRTKTQPEGPPPTTENTRYREGKTAHQQQYLAFLRFVNETYGRLSEALDFLEVLKSSLVIDGVQMTKWNDWTDILAMIADGGDVELDLDKLMFGVLEEQIGDALIGRMSQVEKEYLLEKFGDSHLINNLMGSPSTWARRWQRMQGAESSILPQDVIYKRFTEEVGRVRELSESLDRKLDKLRKDLQQ